jgi:hypothetical protein
MSGLNGKEDFARYALLREALPFAPAGGWILLPERGRGASSPHLAGGSSQAPHDSREFSSLN